MFRHLLFLLAFAVAVVPAAGQVLQECAFDTSTAPPPAPPFSGGAGPGAQLYFPNHGTINILMVFVLRSDDSFEDCHDPTQIDPVTGNPVQIDRSICYQGPDTPTATSWTDDEATEWPVYWSQEPDRRLPMWAENGYLAEPGTNPASFAEGSLSQYYYLMSNGELEITGYIYPEVYITEHDSQWYEDNVAPFDSATTKQSHEIISYVRDNPEGIVFDDRFDQHENGTNNVGPFEGDDIFDMIVIVMRSGPGITSFGSVSQAAGFDGFAPDPLFLGDLQVTDNIRYGSGVRSTGYSVLTSTYITAHEIGHRQFGYYHESEGGNQYRGHSTSIMEASPDRPASMSGSDRVKLGWLHPDTLDVSTFTHTSWTLDDALTAHEALYIQDGSPASGDVLIVNRGHSNFWDRPADGTNADGDNGDHFFVEEGLYIYKAGIDNGGLGGTYTSMEITGGAFRDGHNTFKTFSTVEHRL